MRAQARYSSAQLSHARCFFERRSAPRQLCSFVDLVIDAAGVPQPEDHCVSTTEVRPVPLPPFPALQVSAKNASL